MPIAQNQRGVSAKDIMTRDVVRVTPDMRVFDAVQLLLRARASAAPVLENGRIVGMFTEKDGIRALMHAVMNSSPSHNVAQVMSTEPFTVHQDAHLLTVAHLFLTKAFRNLPVVDDAGRLVGNIARADLLRKAVEVWGTMPSREAAILFLSATEARRPV